MLRSHGPGGRRRAPTRPVISSLSFVRVLTDRAFKALIFDVIVAQDAPRHRARPATGAGRARPPDARAGRAHRAVTASLN